MTLSTLLYADKKNLLEKVAGNNRSALRDINKEQGVSIATTNAPVIENNANDLRALATSQNCKLSYYVECRQEALFTALKSKYQNFLSKLTRLF